MLVWVCVVGCVCCVIGCSGCLRKLVAVSIVCEGGGYGLVGVCALIATCTLDVVC